MPKALPVAVLEAKKESDDPLKGMQQATRLCRHAALRREVRLCHQRPQVRRVRPLHELINGPFQFSDFPPHPDLTARYAKDSGIDLTRPEAAMLFQADSPAWSQSRYYQDAAIRAAFEKILLDGQAGKPPRVLLTLATGAGKTIIATNLLWRLAQAGQLPKPALFLCDRDELREQAYTKLKAAFGDNARIVETGRAATRRRTPASTSPPIKRWAGTMRKAVVSPASSPNTTARMPSASSSSTNATARPGASGRKCCGAIPTPSTSA
jgi:type I restriction enzyme R subunit